jgi:phosphate starvation-inducible PhoH-like protein
LSTELTIPLRSHDEAILVLGPYDRHAKLLRQSLAIELFTRGGNLRLKGQEAEVEAARVRIEHLLGKHRKGRELKPREIEAILLDQEATLEPRAGGPQPLPPNSAPSLRSSPRPSSTRPGFGGAGREREDDPGRAYPRRTLDANAAVVTRSLRINAIEPRTQNQRRYLEALEKTPLVFGLGAAGSGKTFLAAAAAVRALREGQVRRLVLTRPVVEAGERLGFLPGDMQAKLDPYMRPIYDALYDLLSFEDVAKLEDYGIIEIAPLAYMRGRTLSHAFVILDEAQNTTVSQMKMFLTRMGEGSRVVVTGDPSQNDLERGKQSGLPDAVRRLRGFAGISVVEFTARDIVRHPLVEQIVRAYEGSRGEGNERDGAAEEAPAPDSRG